MTNDYLRFKFIIISYVNKYNKYVICFTMNILAALIFVHNTVHKADLHCEYKLFTAQLTTY